MTEFCYTDHYSTILYDGQSNKNTVTSEPQISSVSGTIDYPNLSVPGNKSRNSSISPKRARKAKKLKTRSHHKSVSKSSPENKNRFAILQNIVPSPEQSSDDSDSVSEDSSSSGSESFQRSLKKLRFQGKVSVKKFDRTKPGTSD